MHMCGIVKQFGKMYSFFQTGLRAQSLAVDHSLPSDVCSREKPSNPADNHSLVLIFLYYFRRDQAHSGWYSRRLTYYVCSYNTQLAIIFLKPSSLLFFGLSDSIVSLVSFVPSPLYISLLQSISLWSSVIFPLYGSFVNSIHFSLSPQKAPYLNL